MEHVLSESKLPNLASQVEILLNLSFSASGNEKNCLDEILHEKVRELCKQLSAFARNPASSDYSHQPADSLQERLFPPYDGGNLIIGDRIQIAVSVKPAPYLAIKPVLVT